MAGVLLDIGSFATSAQATVADARVDVADVVVMEVDSKELPSPTTATLQEEASAVAIPVEAVGKEHMVEAHVDAGKMVPVVEMEVAALAAEGVEERLPTERLPTAQDATAAAVEDAVTMVETARAAEAWVQEASMEEARSFSADVEARFPGMDGMEVSQGLGASTRSSSSALRQRIAELQVDYFADDLVPPEPQVFGWSDAQLVDFFESGGRTGGAVV
jgi:hypothetical protein